jgi:hypothetical protein
MDLLKPTDLLQVKHLPRGNMHRRHRLLARRVVHQVLLALMLALLHPQCLSSSNNNKDRTVGL